jgi:hypothetical protein
MKQKVEEGGSLHKLAFMQPLLFLSRYIFLAAIASGYQAADSSIVDMNWHK